MGLTTWKNAPAGPIRMADVVVAKNYLTQQEITELNRIVTMYLDFAEDQARRHKPMHMAEWIGRLDGFLQFNERDILTHAGYRRRSPGGSRSKRSSHTTQGGVRWTTNRTPTLTVL